MSLEGGWGRVSRFAHGSRVPGWDEPVDLDKDPAGVPDLATTPVPDALRAQIEASMAKYPDRRSAVIPALHAAQELYGWCSPEAMDQVAAVMGMTPGYCASIASFYDMFDTEPRGRNRVFVCTNISCSLLGADRVLDAVAAAAAAVEDIQVRGFECLGACDMAPMASINGDYVGPLAPEDAEEIVSALRAGRPVLADRSLARRLSVDPGAASSPGTDTVLPASGDPVDRPGPSAPIELAQPPETDDG